MAPLYSWVTLFRSLTAVECRAHFSEDGSSPVALFLCMSPEVACGTWQVFLGGVVLS